MLFLVTSPILSHCPHNGWPNPFLISVYPMKSAQISITPITNSHAPFILTPGCYKVVPWEIVSWFSTTSNEFWMFLYLPWTQELLDFSTFFMALNMFAARYPFLIFVSCFHHLGNLGMGQKPMKLQKLPSMLGESPSINQRFGGTPQALSHLRGFEERGSQTEGLGRFVPLGRCLFEDLLDLSSVMILIRYNMIIYV